MERVVLVPDIMKVTLADIHSLSIVKSMMCLTIDYEQYKRFCDSDFGYGVKGSLTTNNSRLFLERLLSSLSNLIYISKKIDNSILSRKIFDIKGLPIEFDEESLKKRVDNGFVDWTLRNFRNKFTHEFESKREFVKKYTPMDIYEDLIIGYALSVTRTVLSDTKNYLMSKYGAHLCLPINIDNIIKEKWEPKEKMLQIKEQRATLFAVQPEGR